MWKATILTGVTIFLFSLNGCGTVTTGGPAPAAVDSPGYKAGYQDGCTTAHGEYTKNHELFKNDRDYYDGWFAGRSGCQEK